MGLSLTFFPAVPSLATTSFYFLPHCPNKAGRVHRSVHAVASLLLITLLHPETEPSQRYACLPSVVGMTQDSPVKKSSSLLQNDQPTDSSFGGVYSPSDEWILSGRLLLDF